MNISGVQGAELAAWSEPGFWRTWCTGMRRHKLATVGVLIIVLMALMSFVGPLLLKLDPTYINVLKRAAPPLVPGHLLGTD